jgi:adenylate cyclase
LSRYRSGHFDKAIAAFEKAISYNPKDKLSRTYIERCEFLKANPPEGQWDGVWVMTDK